MLKKSLLFLILLLICFLFSKTVSYKATFTGKWEKDSFNKSPFFPAPRDHFTPLFLLTHNEQMFVFRIGELASKGVEILVEEGKHKPIVQEVKKQKKNFFSFKVGPQISRGNSRVSKVFKASDKFPYLSSIMMIAPSSDWFVGVDSINLKDEKGRWYKEINCDLSAYDAGTEDGVKFSQGNSASKPIEPVDLLANREEYKESGFDFNNPFSTLNLKLSTSGLDKDLIGDVIDCN